MDLHSFLFFKLQAGPIRVVVWEVLYIVVLVQVLAVVLNRFLFAPVMAVLDERKRSLETAVEEREDALRALETRTRDHEERVAAARREALQALDSARREAEGARRAQVDEARKTAEGRIVMARDAVARATKKGEHELKLQALQLGRSIAARMLGREVA